MTASPAAPPIPQPVAKAQASLRALAERWAGVKSAERANAQSYLNELCAALGVQPPRPAGSGYEFELAIKVPEKGSVRETTNYIDLYKQDHFVLEAKHAEAGEDAETVLKKAYAQARTYAGHVPGGVAPPYIFVLDVARTLIVWDRWTAGFPGFSSGKVIDLRTLHERPDDIALLRDIWENPTARDPRLHAQAVTRAIADKLARLAAALERRGFAQERVSRFLIRCVFTMFAEDVGLLKKEPFRELLHEVAVPDPAEFVPAAEDLWRAMNEGGRFGYHKVLRFNGHFFQDAEALPLTRDDLGILLESARADWSKVEPSIFGTLLVRALDATERHRLGAEYTPREFIERVVKPAVEEPIRERWVAVQAAVKQLRDTGKPRDKAKAESQLREFHSWLRSLRFLDSACGSGNFLYVTMHLVKRVEVEVLRELAELTGAHELRMEEVDPSQFYGIEVKPWAREIAELTLWIGFHQFWRQQHDPNVQPAEPLLRDTGTLENRDAVLAWDEVRHDPTRDRPDPTPRIKHPVTGELVPDPSARLPYYDYVGARQAEWPEADFIVGNPPYLGNKRMREALGDGYVEALRTAYPEIPESADFAMYWWHRAAVEVSGSRTIRAGLITTNTITQIYHQQIVERAEAAGAVVTWAAPDHPWVDDVNAAAVRVALTVVARQPPDAVRVDVDDSGRVLRETRVHRLNADLSAHADVAGASAISLEANQGLASRGFTLVGRGFVLEPEEARWLIEADARDAEVVRPYRNGKDFADKPRQLFVIDFGLMNEADARSYPRVFDIARNRVKPERAANGRASYRQLWWRFGEPRRELRPALEALGRYIATPYVSRHRFFVFLDAAIAADKTLVAIASDDPYVFGVLSSRIQQAWALAAGTRLGVGNDPRYNHSRCFAAFPFPEVLGAQRDRIRTMANRLDRHRCDALAGDDRVTMTGMYNVVEKLRANEPLTPKERSVHELAACGVLRDLHDELDALVAEAYGWPWPLDREQILERLVALHDERVREEAAGHVRWLRPDYQVPRFGKDVAAPAATLGLPDETAAPAPAAAAPVPWPADAVGQLTALQQLANAAPISVEEAVKRFTGAKRDIVERHLETLALLGELQRGDDGRYGVPVAAY